MALPLEFSVIIPTCNRLDKLRACLDCLSPQVEHFSCEVIVSDDGDDPRVREVLAREYPWATWVSGPRKGPAANRNKGASKAIGQWLIFIDDDCLPDFDFIDSYMSYFREHPEARVAEGVIYSDRPQRSLGEGCPQNLKGQCFWSCNLALLKEAFDTLGGFDEDFLYPAYEDLDLYRRIQKGGLEVAFVSTARVCHPWRKLTTWRRFWQQRHATLTYLKKHPEEMRRLTGWIVIKIAVVRMVRETVPKGIAFRGRGLPGALVFDLLDCLFGLFLGTRAILRRLAMRFHKVS